MYVGLDLLWCDERSYSGLGYLNQKTWNMFRSTLFSLENFFDVNSISLETILIDFSSGLIEEGWIFILTNILLNQIVHSAHSIDTVKPTHVFTLFSLWRCIRIHSSKPNQANVMEVPGLCTIRVASKAPYDLIIINGKLAVKINSICYHKKLWIFLFILFITLVYQCWAQWLDELLKVRNFF